MMSLFPILFEGRGQLYTDLTMKGGSRKFRQWLAENGKQKLDRYQIV